MTTVLLARDVTRELGPDAAGQRVSVTASVLALAFDADQARWESRLLSLVRHILTGKDADRHTLPDPSGARLVVLGRFRFLLIDGAIDGTRTLTIATWPDVQLAGGFGELVFDVREQVRPEALS